MFIGWVESLQIHDVRIIFILLQDEIIQRIQFSDRAINVQIHRIKY